MTPTSSPPAASTTTQCPTRRLPASRDAESAERERRADRDGAREREPGETSRSGTSASDDRRERRQRDDDRDERGSHGSVTEAPAGRRVAGAELGEDPEVEERRDERDQRQVERDAELDQSDGRAGSSSAASASPFSTSTIPITWNSVGRRIATLTSPNATSASTARSAFASR